MSAQLAKAAQAVIDRWDSPQWEWTKHGPTADLIADLRKELAAFEAAPQQEPVGRVRFDSGEVHFYPFQRDAEASPLSDGAQLYAAPQQAQAPNLHAMQMLWDDQSSEERAHYMAVAARIANEDAAQQQSQEQP